MRAVNTPYKSPGLSAFYSSHRLRYSDFYPSERAAFESLDLGPETTILDIGCACGGLGLALNEHFGCTDYTGLEIHAEAARIGHRHVSTFGGRVVGGDVLEAARLLTANDCASSFDLVVSLSALDWNLRVASNVRAAWALVRDGGHLLMSVRLHPDTCLLDLHTSYQPTTPEASEAVEIAPYVVMAVPSAMQFAAELGAAQVTVFGHVGRPSSTAVTTVDECIFAVAVMAKDSSSASTIFDIRSPAELVDVVHEHSANST
jgi:SAM-dependent methyltransferase